MSGEFSLQKFQQLQGFRSTPELPSVQELALLKQLIEASYIQENALYNFDKYFRAARPNAGRNHPTIRQLAGVDTPLPRTTLAEYMRSSPGITPIRAYNQLLETYSRSHRAADATVMNLLRSSPTFKEWY